MDRESKQNELCGSVKQYSLLLSLCEQLVSLLPALTLTMPSEKNRKTAFIETLHSKRGW